MLLIDRINPTIVYFVSCRKIFNKRKASISVLNLTHVNGLFRALVDIHDIPSANGRGEFSIFALPPPRENKLDPRDDDANQKARFFLSLDSLRNAYRCARKKTRQRR